MKSEMKCAMKSSMKNPEDFSEKHYLIIEDPVKNISKAYLMLQEFQDAIFDASDIEIDHPKANDSSKIGTQMSKASLTSRKKQKQIRNLHLQIQGQDLSTKINELDKVNKKIFFKSIEQSKVLQENLPFYSEKQSFVEFYQKGILSIKKLSNQIQKLHQSVDEVQNYHLESIKKIKVNQIKKQMDDATRKFDLEFEELQMIYKQKYSTFMRTCYEEEFQERQFLTIIYGYEQLKNQNAQLKELKSKRINQREILDNRISMKSATIMIDMFENSISKLQFGDIFYRYGAQVVKGSLDKFSLLKGEAFKWNSKVQPIDFSDLKIFVLTMLYPMSKFIFNDFSHQSNVYKVMFGLNIFLSQEEIDSSLLLLKRRIQKHYTEKKFVSLDACLSNNGKLKKKKMLFVCTQDKLDQILDQLIRELKNFSNAIIAILDAKVQMTEQILEGTMFRHGKMTIDYVFQKSSSSIVIQILFCTFQEISRDYIDIARKKTSKYESVLFWLDIPKTMGKEKLQEIRQIDSTLGKYEHFSLDTDRKKQRK